MNTYNLSKAFSRIFFLIVAILIPLQSFAESRPKIGLVLGGGGARGAAHAGVLKVLEENNVPIDYIVGTSMGSIVGGLYSSGYSPEEIERLFNKVDWIDMFTDRPKENMVSFRNKRDYEKLAVFEFGIKDGKITFPRGIVSGQKLSFMLNKLTIHTIDVEHFDNLQIPFRAVATDAETGDAVIFEKGNLAKAIRASISVPGVFPPVIIHDRLLFDGFPVMNVPVEVVKEMGADIIIAVDVGNPLLTKDKLSNAAAVINQMMNILALQNVKNSLALLTNKDILINPALGEMTPADFVDTPKAIKIGEEAAFKVINQIQKYSVNKSEFSHYIARQRLAERTTPIIDFIKVKKTKRVHPKVISGRLKTKSGGQLDMDVLESDLTRIYAIGDFETVGFDVVEENNKKGLLIDTTEKNWGPNYLRFGLNLISTTEGQNDYNLLLDYRRTQINKLGGELKFVGQVGQTLGTFTEFYQPLDYDNYFFIAPHITFERESQDVYSGDNRIAEYQIDELGGGFDFGINFRNNVEIRAGLKSSIINAEPQVGDTNLLDYSDIRKAGLIGSIDYDQLDDHKFPTKGTKSEIKFFFYDEGLGADNTYKKLDFLFLRANTFKEKHTFIASFDGGISLEDDTPDYDKYTLGGFLSLSGLGKNQLRGKNMGSGKLTYYYKLAEMQGFASKVYIGGSLEAGNVWEDKEDFANDPILGASAFIGIDTMLGPLYIGYGQAEGTDGKGYLFLGRTF